MPHPNPTAVCISCKQTLPREEFAIRYATRNGQSILNGIYTTCLACQAEDEARKNRPDYIVDAETGCWNWQREMSQGYGRIAIKKNGYKTYTPAHRVYYEREHGPMPKELVIDHLCRNPACVNPAHLEAVTIAENSRRGKTARLTPNEVRAIRQIGRHHSRAKVAKMFGVCPTTILDIVRGDRWQNIDDSPYLDTSETVS